MTQRATWKATIRAVPNDPRRVVVTASTGSRGRDNLVIPGGAWDLTAYRRNPIILLQHDPDRPIANAIDISVRGDDLIAVVKFPPFGVSRTADEALGLIKAGVISAASTGFDPIKSELIDRNDPSKGTRIVRAELQEISFVSVPALPDALVTERRRPPSASRPAPLDTMEAHRARARLWAAEMGIRLDRPAPRARMTPAQHREMARLFEAELAAERGRGR